MTLYVLELSYLTILTQLHGIAVYELQIKDWVCIVHCIGSSGSSDLPVEGLKVGLEFLSIIKNIWKCTRRFFFNSLSEEMK